MQLVKLSKEFEVWAGKYMLSCLWCLMSISVKSEEKCSLGFSVCREMLLMVVLNIVLNAIIRWAIIVYLVYCLEVQWMCRLGC